MTPCKGAVKNNAIVLEEGVRLHEGAEVEVRLVEPTASRKELVDRMRANRIHRYVGIDEIIAEDKRENDERVDRLLQ